MRFKDIPEGVLKLLRIKGYRKQRIILYANKMIQRTVPYTIGVVGTRRAVSSKDSTERCAATKTLANKGLCVIGGASNEAILCLCRFCAFYVIPAQAGIQGEIRR